MDKLFKILATTRFITTAFFSGPRPGNAVFRQANRQAFDRYLSGLKGQDQGSELWRKHLLSTNYYCDQKNVALLDDELTHMKEAYRPETPTTVHRAVAAEQALFEPNADKFPVDSLDHDLRKYRPGACFLPDGDIKLSQEHQ